LPKGPRDAVPEAVLLNTAGGLTGGDTLRLDAAAAPETHAVFTTQASERAYRSISGNAHVDVKLSVAKNARIDWLPQETILFDGSRLERTFNVNMAPGASLLAHESLVFGRTAMGEQLREGFFSDRWRIRRNNKLIHADALRIDGKIAEALSKPALLDSNCALGTVLFVSDAIENYRNAMQEATAAIHPEDGVAGVSLWDGKLVIRAVAPGGQSLRRIVGPLIDILIDGRGLPRVWSI